MQQTDLNSKVLERIKAIMPDLITDAEIKALVDRAIDEAFFKSKTIHDPYGRQTEVPPAIVTLLNGALNDRVAEAIKAWIDAHPEAVTKAIDDAIAKGMFGLVQQHMDNVVQGPLMMFASSLRANGFKC